MHVVVPDRDPLRVEALENGLRVLAACGERVAELRQRHLTRPAGEIRRKAAETRQLLARKDHLPRALCVTSFDESGER